MGVVAVVTAHYGRTVGGYGKQYGASLADLTAGSFFTAGVLPSILHQDPRYFQRGSGGWLTRVGYAASRVAVTTSDAGNAQFNWSEVAGHLATAGVSNAYYPAADRTLWGALVRCGSFIALDALSYELKEFWPDLRRWWKHRSAAAEPQS
jgi:hypothetical protein